MKAFLALIGLLLCCSASAERDPVGASSYPEQRPQRPTLEAESVSERPAETSSAPTIPSTSQPDTSRIVVPETHIRPLDEPSQPSEPTNTDYRFERLSADCINDAPFSLMVKGSTPPQTIRWFIKTPSNMMALQIWPTNSYNTIMLKVHQLDHLQPGLSYPLYFQLSNNRLFQHSHIFISACQPDKVSETPHSGELLMLIDKSALTSFNHYAEQHNINTTNVTPLYSDKILITSRATPAHLNRLRNQLAETFPSAEIDTNDYLTPAEKPRTYAKAQLNWPKERCQTLTMPVGIIDGTVDENHLSLAGQTLLTKTFIDDAIKDTDHATAISVILAGNNQDEALNGLLNEATLYVANVIEDTLFGKAASVSAIAQALAWFSASNVRLVNISLSGRKANRVLAKVTEDLSQAGMLIFAAVGNNAEKEHRYYPAAFQSVIAVTAIDAANKLYRSANQGDYIDFAAPGVDLWTADDELAGQYRSGTSYATPYVVATAANILSVNPQMPRALIYQSLKASALDLGEKGRDEQFGWGAVQYRNTCPP